MKRASFLLYILLFNTLYTSAQPIQYEIYAIEFAYGEWKPYATDIAVGAQTNDSLEGNFVIWLLKGKNKLILVDAGYTDTTQYPTSNFTRPDVALRKLNISAKSITDIILTHPHFDHMGGIDLFPNAMIWIQQKDFDYFMGTAWQQNGMSKGFNKDDVCKLAEKNINSHLTLVQGDSIEIIPGIRVFTGSKHTYESQYVLVNGTSGKTIIASDNIWFYYNLNHLLAIPTFTFDPQAYINAMKRMKTLVNDARLIIPGHDATVFKKFPSVTNNVVKIELSTNNK